MLTYDDLEIILRQVRVYMKVGETTRLSEQKLFLVHKNPDLNFSKWLMQIIGLQIMWKEITKQ